MALGPLSSTPSPLLNPLTGLTAPPQSDQSYEQFATRLGNDREMDYLNLDRANVRTGLSQYLGQIRQQITPEAAAELQKSELGQKFLVALDRASQGQIDENAVTDIQGLLSGAGINISNDYDTDGIDGAYGLQTHRGLGQLIGHLRSNPQSALQNLPQRQAQVQQDVAETRRYLAASPPPTQVGFPDRRQEPNTPAQPVQEAQRRQRHRQTDVQPAAPAVAGYSAQYNSPEAAQRGQAIATRARRTAMSMGGNKSISQCYTGVARALAGTITLSGKSAYMAADQLARSPKFKEVTVSPADLRKLPPGAVVVWGKTEDSPHGHISIAQGNGREASDYVGNQMTSLRGHTNFRVFIPN